MEEQLTVEQLQERVDLLIKKSREVNDLKNGIIKLQEDLIGGMKEQLDISERRGVHSFRAGLWFGLVVGTVICIIANIIITTIR